MSGKGNKPWYDFTDGDCFVITLKDGDVFKYKHVGASETGQAKVEINGEVKTVNEVFKNRDIERSEVRKIECSEM